MYDFNGKTVVVTGAAQGIGLEIAKRFAEESAACVAILDLKQEALETAAAEIDPAGKMVFPAVCDVTDTESVRKVFDNITKKTGKIDILINNAGITRDAMAHKMTQDQFDMVVKVSLYGAFNCASQVLAGMKERGYGRIISLSSLASRGNVGQANYAAAKAGVIGLTKTMSLEAASRGVTVNCIAPGMIYTDMIRHVPEKVQESMKNMVPMKRFGEPREVANVAVFLASDEASYISGQCIYVTGGWF